MIKRRETRRIKVGDVVIGGGAPISIQSMTKVETSDVKAVVSQIRRLEDAGCEIVRVAVKDMADAGAIRAIKKRINIPLVADIHFNYRLALRSIANGADKIRLNPGNIRARAEIQAVVRAAKKARIPVRIGVNSGSVPREAGTRRPEVRGRASEAGLVAAACDYIKIFEESGFRDIIISLKASDCISTIEAYRRIARLCDYPLHLGVTASGPAEQGIIKSAIGIGALLADGIGDTVRVSLTADPADEVIAAKNILSSLGLRRFGPEIIACPTCGRCRVDLAGIAKELESKLHAPRYTLYAKYPATIALMGCEVNGPGESADADIGIAAGKGSGMLFVHGKPLRRVREKDFVKEILKELKTQI